VTICIRRQNGGKFCSAFSYFFDIYNKFSTISGIKIKILWKLKLLRSPGTSGKGKFSEPEKCLTVHFSKLKLSISVTTV
jgi:hypothetical protein